jgi:hypothetical protein
MHREIITCIGKLLPRSSISYFIWQDLIDNLYIYIGVDVVEWSMALDVRLSEWCCSVSMVWVQMPSREEQKFDSSKI